MTLAATFDALFRCAAERLCRLELFLARVEKHASEAERRLVHVFREHLHRHQNDFLRVTRENLNSAEEFADLSQIYDTLSNCGTLHSFFDMFVSRPPIPPELYAILDDCCPSSDVEPTVVAFGGSTFAEIDMGEIFGPDVTKRVTIWLPFADLTNALIWPAMAHELGHALFKGRQVADSFGAPKADHLAAKMLEAWAGEFWADIIGLEMFGPAYLNAFLSSVLIDHPREYRPTETHPPVSERVDYMVARLRARTLGLGAAGTQLVEVLRSLIEAYGYNTPEVPLLLPKDELFRKLESSAAQVSFRHQYGATVEGVAQKLVMKAAGGVRLTSSVCLEGPTAADIASLSGLEDEEAVYAVLNKAKETPASAAAILVGGWDHKVAADERAFTQALKNLAKESGEAGEPAREFFKEIADHLAVQDTNMMKSLETSKIHGILA